MLRISSSSLSWIARPSRFCVFWIRNTMRNVTIVVPVLMTNCQVSEKWNNGPVIPHIKMITRATINAHGEPTTTEVLLENFLKKSFMLDPPACPGGKSNSSANLWRDVTTKQPPGITSAVAALNLYFGEEFAMVTRADLPACDVAIAGNAVSRCAVLHRPQFPLRPGTS